MKIGNIIRYCGDKSQYGFLYDTDYIIVKYGEEWGHSEIDHFVCSEIDSEYLFIIHTENFKVICGDVREYKINKLLES